MQDRTPQRMVDLPNDFMSKRTQTRILELEAKFDAAEALENKFEYAQELHNEFQAYCEIIELQPAFIDADLRPFHEDFFTENEVVHAFDELIEAFTALLNMKTALKKRDLDVSETDKWLLEEQKKIETFIKLYVDNALAFIKQCDERLKISHERQLLNTTHSKASLFTFEEQPDLSPGEKGFAEIKPAASGLEGRVSNDLDGDVVPDPEETRLESAIPASAGAGADSVLLQKTLRNPWENGGNHSFRRAEMGKNNTANPAQKGVRFAEESNAVRMFAKGGVLSNKEHVDISSNAQNTHAAEVSEEIRKAHDTSHYALQLRNIIKRLKAEIETKKLLELKYDDIQAQEKAVLFLDTAIAELNKQLSRPLNFSFEIENLQRYEKRVSSHFGHAILLIKSYEDILNLKGKCQLFQSAALTYLKSKGFESTNLAAIKQDPAMIQAAGNQNAVRNAIRILEVTDKALSLGTGATEVDYQRALVEVRKIMQEEKVRSDSRTGKSESQLTKDVKNLLPALASIQDPTAIASGVQLSSAAQHTSPDRQGLTVNAVADCIKAFENAAVVYLKLQGFTDFSNLGALNQKTTKMDLTNNAVMSAVKMLNVIAKQNTNLTEHDQQLNCLFQLQALREQEQHRTDSKAWWDRKPSRLTQLLNSEPLLKVEKGAMLSNIFDEGSDRIREMANRAYQRADITTLNKVAPLLANFSQVKAYAPASSNTVAAVAPVNSPQEHLYIKSRIEVFERVAKNYCVQKIVVEKKAETADAVPTANKMRECVDSFGEDGEKITRGDISYARETLLKLEELWEQEKKRTNAVYKRDESRLTKMLEQGLTALNKSFDALQKEEDAQVIVSLPAPSSDEACDPTKVDGGTAHFDRLVLQGDVSQDLQEAFPNRVAEVAVAVPAAPTVQQEEAGVSASPFTLERDVSSVSLGLNSEDRSDSPSSLRRQSVFHLPSPHADAGQEFDRAMANVTVHQTDERRKEQPADVEEHTTIGMRVRS